MFVRNVSHKTNLAAATQAINILKEKYTITGGNDLQWFLGVEIIRLRDQHLIQLLQASYVDKISRLAYNRSVCHNTPMATIELKLYTGHATLSEVNKY